METTSVTLTIVISDIWQSCRVKTLQDREKYFEDILLPQQKEMEWCLEMQARTFGAYTMFVASGGHAVEGS